MFFNGGIPFVQAFAKNPVVKENIVAYLFNLCTIRDKSATIHAQFSPKGAEAGQKPGPKCWQISSTLAFHEKDGDHGTCQSGRGGRPVRVGGK